MNSNNLDLKRNFKNTLRTILHPKKTLRTLERISNKARKTEDNLRECREKAKQQTISNSKHLKEIASENAKRLREQSQESARLLKEQSIDHEKNIKKIYKEKIDLEKKISSLRKTIDVFRGLNRSAFREDAAYQKYHGKTLINIGAGHFHHERWTNLDVSSEHYQSQRKGSYVEYNIIEDENIPFQDGSISLAYTSHTIEHIKDVYVYRMFDEVYRCLEPGGIFRVTCPNADLFYTAAMLGNTDRFFHRSLAWFERKGVPSHTASPLDYVAMAVATALTETPRVIDQNEALSNEISEKFKTLPKAEFLDWLCGNVDFSIDHIACHINWWTIEKVTSALKSAGFSLVRSSVCGGSLAAPMCDTTKFDNTMADESLYVEAYKL